MYQGVKPLIAIVGRPNVGKSTLFNRLVGRPEAIVSWVAGTTRDRVIREAEWGGRSLIIIDTGGLDISPETELSQKVTAQIRVAVEDADVIIALTDIANGVVAADRDVADVLRRSGKPDAEYPLPGACVKTVADDVRRLISIRKSLISEPRYLVCYEILEFSHLIGSRRRLRSE